MKNILRSNKDTENQDIDFAKTVLEMPCDMKIGDFSPLLTVGHLKAMGVQPLGRDLRNMSESEKRQIDNLPSNLSAITSDRIGEIIVDSGVKIESTLRSLAGYAREGMSIEDVVNLVSKNAKRNNQTFEELMYQIEDVAEDSDINPALVAQMTSYAEGDLPLSDVAITFADYAEKDKLETNKIVAISNPSGAEEVKKANKNYADIIKQINVFAEANKIAPSLAMKMVMRDEQLLDSAESFVKNPLAKTIKAISSMIGFNIKSKLLNPRMAKLNSGLADPANKPGKRIGGKTLHGSC